MTLHQPRDARTTLSIFSGLSAFPVTPADQEGVVDLDALGVLLERLVQARVVWQK